MVVDTGRTQEPSDTDIENWRRKCGCIRTSEKLKKILKTFPSPPPPTPLPTTGSVNSAKCPETCLSSYCYYTTKSTKSRLSFDDEKKLQTRSPAWCLISEVVQLVQLSVTATALAIYYLIYCYMQLVYFTLRSAIYFHNADGPMKITIGVVTLTSIVVGFNLLVRMERLLGVLY